MSWRTDSRTRLVSSGVYSSLGLQPSHCSINPMHLTSSSPSRHWYARYTSMPAHIGSCAVNCFHPSIQLPHACSITRNACLFSDLRLFHRLHRTLGSIHYSSAPGATDTQRVPASHPRRNGAVALYPINIDLRGGSLGSTPGCPSI